MTVPSSLCPSPHNPVRFPCFSQKPKVTAAPGKTVVCSEWTRWEHSGPEDLGLRLGHILPPGAFHRMGKCTTNPPPTRIPHLPAPKHFRCKQAQTKGRELCSEKTFCAWDLLSLILWKAPAPQKDEGEHGPLQA